MIGGSGQDGDSLTLTAPTAHVRRKFFELHAVNGSPVAAEALRRIGMLYVVEQLGRDLDATARLRLRQEQAKPALAELHIWLLTAKAIDYTLRRWPALLRYAESGTLPIDNNPVENASGLSPLARKTGCSPARSGRAAAPPPSRACLVPPNSTASIRCAG